SSKPSPLPPVTSSPAPSLPYSLRRRTPRAEVAVLCPPAVLWRQCGCIRRCRAETLAVQLRRHPRRRVAASSASGVTAPRFSLLPCLIFASNVPFAALFVLLLTSVSPSSTASTVYNWHIGFSATADETWVSCYCLRIVTVLRSAVIEFGFYQFGLVATGFLLFPRCHPHRSQICSCRHGVKTVLINGLLGNTDVNVGDPQYWISHAFTAYPLCSCAQDHVVLVVGRYRAARCLLCLEVSLQFF
ncbi:hypothetical protein SORBI_3002G133700, partial [Sorghum bicolor]